MFDDLKDLLICILLGCFCFFIFSCTSYFICEIEESNLEKIRYCPNCGYDLIEFREE